ncbi:molybdopterin-dependent oxidoreductase, partial [Streptomyces sp. OspMP-M43]
MSPVPTEDVYDRIRMRQWTGGRARSAGIDRRDLLKLVAAASAAVPLASVAAPARAADGLPGVVKPLPPELFTLRGTNAETKFEALRDTGLLTPADRFFVRNHTATPRIDRADWKLTVWGDGLSGGPVDFTFADLLALPPVTRTAFVECAGNGRSYFASQQGQAVSGTAWTLGAIGTARWHGVRLADVLRRAGIGRHAVDVLPRGLDAEVVTDGVNLGRVRRPLPVVKALDDVLLAYGMNGEPLPPDHGCPVRLIVPSWVGIANIKWVGDIEVSSGPLLTPWNTGLYRLFGPGHPPEGSAPLTRQTLKSAFELAPGAAFRAHRRTLLTGRSWSGGAPVRAVEVSTDGGARWRAARLRDEPR